MTITDYLKKYFILCAPGGGFAGKGWVRLAYCVSEKCIENSRKAFIQAMKDLNKQFDIVINWKNKDYGG